MMDEQTVSTSNEENQDKGIPKKKLKLQDEWECEENSSEGNGVEWKSPKFPDPYVPLPDHVKFYYDGREMKLSPDAEEVAGLYAKMLKDKYLKKDIFNKKFFKDWKESMTDIEKTTITDLKKCNFKPMYDHFANMAELAKKAKKPKANKAAMNGVCEIDGHEEEIDNRIEPIVGIKCINTASWFENVRKRKYIHLSPCSELNQKKDLKKYETARKLHKYIVQIRKDYKKDWKSKDNFNKRRGVALYFIDKLLLRVGNEKGEGQAETFGCCSLLVKHIKLHDHKDKKNYVVVFDFIGKSYVRYYNEVSVPRRVYKNLKSFTKKKNQNDKLFDELDAKVLNAYLKKQMEGLTAKVFRTYNASMKMQQLLAQTNEEDGVTEKISTYKDANKKVAKLCNHKKSGQNEQSDLESEPQADSESDPQSDSESDPQSDLESDLQSNLESDPQLDSESDLQSGLESDQILNLESDSQSDLESDLPSNLELDSESDPQSDFESDQILNLESDSQSDLESDLPSNLKLDSESDPQSDFESDQILNLESDPQSDLESDLQINLESDSQLNLESDPQLDLESDPQLDLESDSQSDSESDPQSDSESDPESDSETGSELDYQNNEISLISEISSKLHYLDPRITFAWCKKFGIPIKQIYTKSQIKKFSWAKDTDETFVF